METTVTIFTPTYNRAHTLLRLYDSIIKQTIKCFEWIIVDDGSTDNTEEVICKIKKDSEIPFLYHKQKNAGKHIAINKGLDLAKGKLFFIVDSDDWLAENAIERINYHYNNIKDEELFGGVCGLKVFADGKRVGGESNFGLLRCNSIDFRYKYHIKGDMAEVYLTHIFKQYRFPDTIGENFCPEALVWNRIAQKYNLLYFYEKIYYCEYLPDGLTAKITRIRMLNPVNSCTYYAELRKENIPLLQKIKAIINYWRFSGYLNSTFNSKLKQIGGLSLFLCPIGYLLNIKDRRINEGFTNNK